MYKRQIIALPVCAGIGAGVSVFWTEDGRVDMATAGFNGATTGLWLGLFGAIAAAITNYFARYRLKKANGSELNTGLVIVFGLAVIGLIILREYA